jgi:hypothetical protein
MHGERKVSQGNKSGQRGIMRLLEGFLVSRRRNLKGMYFDTNIFSNV